MPLYGNDGARERASDVTNESNNNNKRSHAQYTHRDTQTSYLAEAE